MDVLPVFPLGTVLLPGAMLSLRIFEERYRRLVRLCGQEKPFVIVRIRSGREVGEPAFVYEAGCTAVFRQLREWPDGRYDVLVEGRERVSLSGFRIEEDGLMMAEAEVLESRGNMAAATLQQLRLQAPQALPGMSAESLCWHVAEMAGLTLDDKQGLLEIHDLEERAVLLLSRLPAGFEA